MTNEENSNKTKHIYNKWEMCCNEGEAYMSLLHSTIKDLRDENAKLKAENAELKEKDIHCANSMDDMIKRCDNCGLFECIGCEHSHAAVMEVKKLKEDYEALKRRKWEVNT